MTTDRTNYVDYLSGQDVQTPTPHSSQGADRVLTAYMPSRASNAADGIVPIGVIPANATITGVYFQPQGSQAGSATNFAIARVLNAGIGGSGTDVVASKSFSAAGASIAAQAGSSLPVASAEVTGPTGLAASYASSGNGIALVPHTITVSYRLR